MQALRHLDAVLGATKPFPGTKMAVLGRLGGVLCRLGALLDVSGPLLGRLGRLHNPSWGVMVVLNMLSYPFQRSR